MIFSSFLVIAYIVTALLAPVQLPGSGAFSDSDVAAIEKAFSSYNEALVDKRYDDLSRHIQVPFVVIDDRPRIIPDIDR